MTPQTPDEIAVTDERAEFEVWFSNRFFRTTFERNVVGQYEDPTTEIGWQCWQARAAFDAARQSEDAARLNDEVEAVACVIGDYGPVDAKRMATVLLDDRKIAECYRNEDAQLIACALNAARKPS
jgi:hypothetical protein